MLRSTVACKLLPNTATEQEKIDAHKIKMLAKKKMGWQMYARQPMYPYVPANLSRNHPDYGMSMEEHLVEKERRNNQKSS